MPGLERCCLPFWHTEGAGRGAGSLARGAGTRMGEGSAVGVHRHTPHQRQPGGCAQESVPLIGEELSRKCYAHIEL